MKLHTLKNTFLSFCALSLVVACNNDDDATTPVAVDPDTDTMDPVDPDPEMMDPEAIDFSGTFSQVDYMGRPGINTVLNGDGDTKDAYNLCIPATMAATFQPLFEARLEGLHDVYAGFLGADPETVNYEPNILGDILNGPEKDGMTDNPVTATVLTTVLANDVLEIAPDFPTTYFNGGSGAPDFTDAIGFTGRTPEDDVIDVSLILLFGGADGARFSGQELDGGGNLPILVSDGVALTAEPTDMFPYLGAPE